jgi:hypothetical protein
MITYIFYPQLRSIFVKTPLETNAKAINPLVKAVGNLDISKNLRDVPKSVIAVEYANNTLNDLTGIQIWIHIVPRTGYILGYVLPLQRNHTTKTPSSQWSVYDAPNLKPGEKRSSYLFLIARTPAPFTIDVQVRSKGGIIASTKRINIAASGQ